MPFVPSLPCPLTFYCTPCLPFLSSFPASFLTKAYEWALAQYLGAGTAACYRGGQLWDNETKAGQEIKGVLKKWVSFYKDHRATLTQPVVHLRRPDMQVRVCSVCVCVCVRFGVLDCEVRTLKH